MLDNLKSLFKSYTGQEADNVVELNSSGSNRRYFRMTGGDGTSIVGVIGLNLKENQAFCGIARHFLDKGIKVPRVLAVSEDGMTYIQEDLGDKVLYNMVSQGRESGEYSSYERAMLRHTMEMLPKLQFKGAEGLDYNICFPEPAFNGRMVMFDLNYFKYCFLKATGLEFDEVRLQDDFEALKEDLLCDNSNTFMYRDFQARNVIFKDGEPYFIDFQGGRRGPIYYDVASFIWQARSRYPEDLKNELVETYLRALKSYVPDIDENVFREKLRLFVLFRTLQVLGAYGFRGYFEKKPHFIASVPFAIDNLRQVVAILKAYGLDGYITIDLGMVHQAGYYSGMIFRGITADLGQPLLSGGRYDGLPARFGREMPATGFAVKMKLLMMALERQGASFTAPVPQVMVGFDADCLPLAVAYAREMREKGVSVAMEYSALPAELEDRVRQGLTKRAVYIAREGNQTWGEEDAPCRT